MLINGLLTVVLNTLKLLLAPINIPQLPDNAISSINDLFGYLEAGAGILANYTDLGYLLTLMGVIVAIDVGIKLYHFVMWILRKIPMLGMS